MQRIVAMILDAGPPLQGASLGTPWAWIGLGSLADPCRLSEPMFFAGIREMRRGGAHRRRDGLMGSSPFCWDCPWDLTSQSKIARGRPSSAALLPTGQRGAVDFLASRRV